MFVPNTYLAPDDVRSAPIAYFPSTTFPTVHPIDWLTSHFAVGGWSPLSRLGGMLTAHMTRIAPRSGFTWHPHRGLEIYTWVLEGKVHHEDTTGGNGDIHAGELQRMFSGDYIEHQELNLWDEPTRVIQIWFVADLKYRGLAPHYQQLRRDELPATRGEGSTSYALIGDGSPIDQHMDGRLSAVSIDTGGSAIIAPPREGEDLFVYLTDGSGETTIRGEAQPLGQYDVILARPDMPELAFSAQEGGSLDALCFYLPGFLK
jgi:redox-sensitive bicupin YhaK (pirin superfamily)